MIRKYRLLLGSLFLCGSVLAGMSVYGLSNQAYHQVVCDSRTHGSDPTIYSCIKSYSIAKGFADAHMKNNPGHNATVMNESGCAER